MRQSRNGKVLDWRNVSAEISYKVETHHLDYLPLKVVIGRTKKILFKGFNVKDNILIQNHNRA